ncbi:MAG: sugar-binding transcriptional regulator [Planctomycetaceae bacterium]|nr:sugar-binding transcriptional regulator [Planctomycetaceae bacterium]
MAKNGADDRLTDLINVCYSHFIYEETQSEIAEKMGVSRAKVCKMIAQAKSMGLYTITINDPLEKIGELSRGLTEKYDLHGVKLVPIPKFGVNDVLQRLGHATAELLASSLKDNDVIGVAGGSTLYEMINFVEPMNISNLFIVPLLGGYAETEAATHGTEIVYRLSDKLRANIINMPVPGLAQNAEEARLFMSNPIISRSMVWTSKCSIALFGIGSAQPSGSFYQAGVITDQLLAELRRENAVGCVCFNFYDGEGRPCEDFNARIIGITLDDIKLTPISIGVAGGMPEKVAAIHGALVGKYINFLVTDQITAESLLALDWPRNHLRTGVPPGSPPPPASPETGCPNCARRSRPVRLRKRTRA